MASNPDGMCDFHTKPIFVPLATAPYDAFKAGTKDVEVRRRDSPVAKQVLRSAGSMRMVVLSKGYSKRARLQRGLGEVWEAESLLGLPDEVLQRAGLMTKGDGRSAGTLRPSAFNIDLGPVVAFEVRR